jgi:hypothetical protein
MSRKPRPEQGWLPWDKAGELERRGQAFRAACEAFYRAGSGSEQAHAMDAAEAALRAVGGDQEALSIRYEVAHGQPLPEEPTP